MDTVRPEHSGGQPRADDVDEYLIDWADGFLQDLVVSFSARRVTAMLRDVVLGLYLFAYVHLVYALVLPFHHDRIAEVIAGGSQIPPAPLQALATGIVVGGMSLHVLLAILYVTLSFLLRTTKRWTQVAATLVLGLNAAVAFNGLRTPPVAEVFTVFNAASLLFASGLIVMVWISSIWNRQLANPLNRFHPRPVDSPGLETPASSHDRYRSTSR
jgi:hypothetical protein